MASSVGECVSKIDVGLTAVPETMLWTLHNRASVAADPNGFLKGCQDLPVH